MSGQLPLAIQVGIRIRDCLPVMGEVIPPLQGLWQGKVANSAREGAVGFFKEVFIIIFSKFHLAVFYPYRIYKGRYLPILTHNQVLATKSIE